MNNISKESSSTSSLSLKSPFHLEDGWTICIENSNKNCTHNEIDILKEKGILNLIDFEIMKLLTRYAYINANNIEYALQHALPSFYRKKSYSRNLKKLVHAGIVIRHQLQFCNPDSNVHGVPAPLRFYKLSAGAYSYLAPVIDVPHNLTYALTDTNIMEQLSVSQFLIHFYVEYGISMQSCKCNLPLHVGSHLFHVDAYIRFRSSKESVDSPVALFILSARGCTEGRSNFITRSLLFFKWLDKHITQGETYMIIIPTESIEHVRSINQTLISHSVPSSLPLYYTIDSDILTFAPFDCIYRCSHDDTSGQDLIERIHLVLFS
ncbi:MAG: hypothetical protein PHW34_09090 [Hespellia sp.]|nr:hypothetical protein [Hespellia sp.]